MNVSYPNCEIVRNVSLYRFESGSIRSIVVRMFFCAFQDLMMLCIISSCDISQNGSTSSFTSSSTLLHTFLLSLLLLVCCLQTIQFVVSIQTCLLSTDKLVCSNRSFSTASSLIRKCRLFGMPKFFCSISPALTRCAIAVSCDDLPRVVSSCSNSMLNGKKPSSVVRPTLSQ